MADERQRLFGGVLPLDDVDSGDIDLAGRLAELVDRLGRAVSVADRDADRRRLGDGHRRGRRRLHRHLASRTPGSASQLQRLLDDLVDEATSGGAVSPVALGPADVRALLADRLRGRPTRANFRTGHLTICTLVPMRSVPHRVVCLLGLDDGVFPRQSSGTATTSSPPTPTSATATPETEDRQLLLDALLAATDRLVITYTGRDERTNLDRPPAVPLGELLDVIDRTVRTDDGRPARDSRRDPPPAPALRRPQLHARGAHRRPAVELRPGQPRRRPGLDRTQRRRPGPWLAAPSRTIELADRRARAPRGVRAPPGPGLPPQPPRRLARPTGRRDLDDALPIDLDALERWEVAERILTARLAGAEPRGTASRPSAPAGQLPPGELADPILDRHHPDGRAAGGARARPTSSRPRWTSTCRSPTRHRLIGTVADLRGDVLHTVTFSTRLAGTPAHRLGPAARAHAPPGPSDRFQAMTIGRPARGRQGRQGHRGDDPGALGADRRRAPGSAPVGSPASLVDLYRRGMREPLPHLLPRPRPPGRRPPERRPGRRQGGEQGWTLATGTTPREDEDPEHVLVLGGAAELRAMMDKAGRPATTRRAEDWHVRRADPVRPLRPPALGRPARHEQLVDS